MEIADRRLIFNDGISSKGGLLDVSVLPGSVQQLHLNYAVLAQKWINDVKAFYLPKMPYVHFDYINSPFFNAVAFKHQNEEFIGVNSGAILIICLVFQRMLADREILVHIGDINKEKSGLTLFPPKLTNVMDILSLKANVMPQDPERLAATNLLTKLAVEFLLHHEYTHLSNGHVDFMLKKSQIPLIAELEMSVSGLMGRMDYQSLEMDADAGAVNHGIEALFGRIKDRDQLPEEQRSAYEDERGILFTWLFAIYSLMRLFDVQKTDLDELANYSHPPARIRQAMAFAVVLELLKRDEIQGVKITDNLRKAFADLIPQVIQQVEEAFQKFCGDYTSIYNLIDAYDPRAQKHVGDILENWKKIRPDLLPLARTNLPE